MRTLPWSRLIAAIVCTGWLLVTLNSNADDRERRKLIVNGILQAIVESQTGRPQGPANFNEQRPPVPRPTSATRELTSARASLQQLCSESAALNASLQREAVGNPNLRGILGDTTKFQTRSDALMQRCNQVSDHRAVVVEVAQLDREWRTLSIRVSQIPKLPKSCHDHVGRMNGFHESLCQHLAVEPSIDRRSLARQAEALSAHVHSLVEDVAFETRSSVNARDLVLEAGRTEQAAIAFAEIANDDVPYRVLLDRYQGFARIWNPLAKRLYSLKSRYVEREIVHVQQAEQKIRELLWLPRGLNRDLLIQLATSIQADVDRVLDTVPLSLLVALPTRDEVPDAAYSLAGYCEHFAECVQRSDNVSELVDAYDELPVAWVSFARHFRLVESAQLKPLLSSIEQRIVALREPLGIPGGFNRDEARKLAASVDHLAEHVGDDVAAWLSGKPGVEAERRDLLTASNALRTAARQLHASISQAAPQEVLERQSEVLYAEWSNLHRRIENSRVPDREHILDVVLRIGGELVQIEALLL